MRNQPPYSLRVLGASEVVAALDFDSTIEALRQMFRGGCAVPVRHHHSVPVPGGRDATLLLMPAWQAGRHVGVKLVTVFPDNGAQSLPSVQGAYLLHPFGSEGSQRGSIEQLVDEVCCGHRAGIAGFEFRPFDKAIGKVSSALRE